MHEGLNGEPVREEVKSAKAKRPEDQEIATIKLIIRRIDGLPDDAQGRVIDYLFQRYTGTKAN